MKHIETLSEFRKRITSGLRQEILDLFLDLNDDGYSTNLTSDQTGWIDWSLINRTRQTLFNTIDSDKIGLYSRDSGYGITVGIHPSRFTNTPTGDVLINESMINVFKFAESYAKKELGLEIAQIYVSKPFSYKYYRTIDSIPKEEVNGIEIVFRFSK